MLAYVAVGCGLVVGGAFRSMLDDAVGPSKIFAMRMTQAIAGENGSVVNIKIFLFRLIVHSAVIVIWPFAIYAEWALSNELALEGGEDSG